MKDNLHESAKRHISGESVFINDMQVAGLLHGTLLYSPLAHARIKNIDISKALKIKGVEAIVLASDVPGTNQMGPVVHDEPCLAEDETHFIGQAIALIAAQTPEIAAKAKAKISIEFEELEAITTIEQAIEKNSRIYDDRIIECGSPENAISKAPFKIQGKLKTGAQEHWYLETQTALCIPGEEDEMHIYSSTQHPSEVQEIVAEVLGVSKHLLHVEVRRLGGAFGGKETQANHITAWCAILAKKTQKPVKMHLFRDDDQMITGKRHRFLSSYEAGFDNKGKILGLNAILDQDAGSSADLSLAILYRALFHIDNAYFIPNLRVTGRAWKTNLPSNTAFRGFGGPQGMAVIEQVIDRIARQLKTDPAIIRQRNFYGTETNNTTPYGQLVENNHMQIIYDQITQTSDYFERRKKVQEFNQKNEYKKRGISLTPVKFGISFTTSFLNQAGALVNIYKDGSMLVHHGGIEMGQGLYTKIIDVAEAESGIPRARIRNAATNTAIVPNTSATAASSGSDMNGMAVKAAIDTIKQRLIPLIEEELDIKDSKSDDYKFENDTVSYLKDDSKTISLPDLIKKAYLKRISLSSTGYYATPNIFFWEEKGHGKPFHYYSFSMAVSEVEVDTLTGESKVLRTDILFDSGTSINKVIDTGQIEGGFIQGLGWVTMEEVKWNAKGQLLNHSPDTYKIPTIAELPDDLRIDFLEGHPNPNTIRKSKAIGEPPFMLSFSVWLAIKDAISSIVNNEAEPDFALPATNEVIVLAAEKLRKA